MVLWGAVWGAVLGLLWRGYAMGDARRGRRLAGRPPPGSRCAGRCARRWRASRWRAWRPPRRPGRRARPHAPRRHRRPRPRRPRRALRRPHLRGSRHAAPAVAVRRGRRTGGSSGAGRATGARRPRPPPPPWTCPPRCSARARDWLFGGNTVVRMGVLVLFVGLAFLAQYAVDNALLPPQLRLAAIARRGHRAVRFGLRMRAAPGQAALTRSRCRARASRCCTSRCSPPSGSTSSCRPAPPSRRWAWSACSPP